MKNSDQHQQTTNDSIYDANKIDEPTDGQRAISGEYDSGADTIAATFLTMSAYPEGNDELDKEDETPDEANEADDDTQSDWGNVDPQEHRGIPSDMDPSGPGSAV